MGSKEDILVRLKKHAVDQVERPEMTFEPLTFFDPLVQFEKIMKAVGGNCVVLEKGQDVNEVIRMPSQLRRIYRKLHVLR